jgi:hypothetical protein
LRVRTSLSTRDAVSVGNSYTCLDGKEYPLRRRCAHFVRPLASRTKRNEAESLNYLSAAGQKWKAKEITVLEDEARRGVREKTLIPRSFPLGWNSSCTARGNQITAAPNLRTAIESSGSCEGFHASSLRTKRSARSRCAKVHCIRPRLRHRFVLMPNLCLALVSSERTAG